MQVQLNKTSWISESFTSAKSVNGRDMFTISGIALSDIVKQISPPFYLYDAETIQRQCAKLMQLFGQYNIGMYYSVKANTSLGIVQLLYAQGMGLEIASLGELLVAKTLRVNPKKISYAGPVKTREEISCALDYGVGTINVEHTTEFSMINTLAKQKGIIQNVGIRINPLQEVSDAGGFMGGGSKKFGIDEECVTESYVKTLKKLTHIRLVGIHVFSATQMLSEKVFLENMENICKIAKRLIQVYPLEYIDFGGGFGIPYSKEESQLPVESITLSVSAMISRYPFLSQKKVKMFFEPGRYLVGASGIYVVTVHNTKTSRGKNILLVDGGIHHMLRPALSLGSTVHPIYNLTKINDLDTETYDIGGSLCTSLDFLGKEVRLPSTHAGDLLGVFNAGAYGWSESMPFFLSHPTPAEVIIYDSAVRILRKSLSLEYLIAQQNLLSERSTV